MGPTKTAGIGINVPPIDPVKSLFWSAVINGVVAVAGDSHDDADHSEQEGHGGVHGSGSLLIIG